MKIMNFNLSEYITPDMWLVAVATYGVCFALKKSAFFPDKLIPLAAIAIGVLLSVLSSVTFSRIDILHSAINGIICGMASVYVANIVKQSKKEK